MPEETVGIRIKIRDAARAISEMKAVEAGIDRIRRAVKTSTGDFKAMSTQGLGTFSALGRGVQTLTSQVANYSRYASVAGGAAIAMGVKTASGVEQANVSFKTLLGSQEAASAKIKELQKFAQDTPFDFTNLVENSRSLLGRGFGADEIIPTMTAIGNAAAAMGGGEKAVTGISTALAQMRNKASLSAEELNQQLSEWGINGWEYLAKAANKSVEQIVKDTEKGLIRGKDASRVILEGLANDPRFQGAMEAQMRTTAGRWNRFVDEIRGKLYFKDEKGIESGAMAPLLGLIRDDVLPAASRLAEKVMPKLERGMGTFVGHVRGLGQAYRIGGMNMLVLKLGEILGVGTDLLPIWFKIRDNSERMGNIWRNSLWPAIQNVASILGPFVLGALSGLEKVLIWMDAHPDAAAAIFTALGTALAVWAIEATIFRIVGGIAGITKGFAAAQMAVLKFTGALKALSLLTGIGGGIPGYGGKLDKKDPRGMGPTWIGDAPGNTKPGDVKKGGGIWGKVKGGLGKGLRVLGPIGAGIGGWQLGSWLVDEYGGDGIIRQDGRIYDESVDGTITYRAGGGPMSVGGPTVVGERGAELTWLPGGAQVTNNQTLMNALNKASSGGQPVVFQEGAFQFNAIDLLNGERVANVVIQKVKDELARL